MTSALATNDGPSGVIGQSLTGSIGGDLLLVPGFPLLPVGRGRPDGRPRSIPWAASRSRPYC